MSIHLHHKGKSLIVRWRDEHNNQCSRVFPNNPVGEAKAIALDAEVKKRKKLGQSCVLQREGLYFDDLVRQFIAEKRLSGASKKWLYEVQNLSNKLLQDLCVAPVDNLTYQHVVEAMQPYLACKVATRNRYQAYLKAIFNFGVEKNLTKSSPMTGWKKSTEEGLQLQLTAEDLALILEKAADHLKWALEVEYYLGTRPGSSELFALKFSDLRMDDTGIFVYGRKTKSWRHVPLPEYFLEKLRARAEKHTSGYVVEYHGKPVNSLRTAWATAKRKAGITYRCRLYDIRHLYATTLLRKGGDLKAVSALLGHSTVVTTQKSYYHLMAGEKARAASLLPRLDMLPKTPVDDQ